MTLSFVRVLSWLPLKKLKLKSKLARRRKSVSPPPPRGFEASGLMVCVDADLMSDNESTLLRFNLPRYAMGRLSILVTKDYDDNNNHGVPYFHHKHPDTFTDRLYYQDGRESLDPLTFGYSGEYRFLDYSFNPVDNRPISSNLIHRYSSSAKPPFLYCIGVDYEVPENDQNVRYTIAYCDMTVKIPTWQTIPLPLYCPRFWPTMITVDDKLFVFRDDINFDNVGGFPETVPFGYLYDIRESSWSEVSFSPFQERSGYRMFVVAAMGQNVLVIDKYNRKQFCFNIRSKSWIDLDVPRLVDLMDTIKGKPITVNSLNAIFWLDKNGEISAYDWVSSKLFYGPHSGFGAECDFKKINLSTLIHIGGDEFGIIWSDKEVTLHITVLHVCLHDISDPFFNAPRHLTSDVVACFRYHLPSLVTSFQEAHLIYRPFLDAGGPWSPYG